MPVACKDIADKSNATEKQVLEAAKELQEKYNEESGIHLLIFNKKLQFCSNPSISAPNFLCVYIIPLISYSYHQKNNIFPYSSRLYFLDYFLLQFL